MISDTNIFELNNVQPDVNPMNSLPLVIAVTGHRDLKQSELGPIKEKVAAWLENLRERFPERRLRVMSSLAEGSDQLVAEIALQLGIELIVPLPMAKAAYIQDFEDPEAVEKFEFLLQRSTESFVLVPSNRNALSQKSSLDWSDKDRQYAQLGVFLAAHCHILLALWDGKKSNRPGGTGHVVQFHHDDELPGYTDRAVSTNKMLVDDESDLIYHIVCSRDRPNGGPHPSLKLLDSFWFTKDELNPRSHDLPTQHENIFRRSGEFSRDASRFADQIEGHKQPLLDSDWPHALAEGIADIDQLYCAADWLALRYQKATLSALRSIHVLAFIMGLMFILYSDLSPLLLYLALFIVAFVFASIVQRVAHRNGWHRKYLDYRALAEGLRVQFYWAAAGIVSPHASKFPHDSFLQLQDPEIGWIRNVMRVAGTRVSAAPQTDDTNLDATIERWIGSDTNGQLGYFTNKTRDVLRRKRITERLGKASLLSGVAVVFIFLIARDALPVEVHALLMIAMGTLLLIYAIRHSYSSSIAEKELLRQFEFMLRVFRDSRRRIESASTAQEKRQILLALGGSALDEQAGWILTHRERSIDSAELMEIGS